MLRYEALGLEDFLRQFGAGELFILADILTRKQDSVKSKDDAIKTIIAYSNSAEEVFRRHKITKKRLIYYLVSKNIEFSIRRSKMELCMKILDFWRDEYQTASPHADEEEIVPFKTIKDGSIPVSQIQGTCDTCTSSGSCALMQEMDTSPPHVTHIENKFNTVNNNVFITYETEKSTTACGQGESTVDVAINPQLQQFGELFTKWFFEHWNAKNPSMYSSVSDFGSNFFWDDASFQSLCLIPEQIKDKATGAMEVTKKLLFFVKDQELVFNPNVTSEGIKVKSDPHGLLIVLVCGTVHRHNKCVGVFDQMFGLIKDLTMHDNWKIQVMKLKINISHVFSMPKIRERSSEEIFDLETV